MNWPVYAAYKDSGVQCIGDIPIDWAALSLRHLLAAPISDGPHETPEFIDSGVPFLSVDGIQDGELVFEGCRYISQEDHLRYSMKARPAKDDVLMGKAASTGKIARVKTSQEFNVWSPLAILRPNTDVCTPSFMEYHLKSEVSQYEIDSLCTSNTQKNISMGDIPRLNIALPPLLDQEEISAFLDAETYKIKALIIKQEKLIATLREDRAATITKAVTKGLDPSVEMMESRIEWIGSVPIHWRISQVRHLVTKIEQGISPQAYGELADEETWGVLKSGCVNGGVFADMQHKKLPEELEFDRALAVKPGDLLVCRASGSRQLVGSTAIVRKLRFRLIMSDKIFRLIPVAGVSAEYLSWVMNSRVYREQVGGSISGAEGLANNLPSSALKGFRFAIPPMAEQDSIVMFLNDRCAKIDNLIAKAVEVIATLREYSSALITAAVTGKIDVRGVS